MNIGIMGMGVVGSAVAAYHKGRGDNVYCYDIATDEPAVLATLAKCADVVFVCVPTPYERTGLDCTRVYEAVKLLNNACGDNLLREYEPNTITEFPGKTVIIKSTVMPGTTDAIQTAWPQHRVFFVPEFLSADTAVEDYAHPRRPHVIGVADGYYTAQNTCIQKIKKLLPLCHSRRDSMELPAWIRCMSAREAELLKLATNAFYALKVAYANMLHDIGMSQDALDALGADPWIGAEHFQIYHKLYRGFGGACLPKDTAALCDLASVEALRTILNAVIQYNNDLRGEQN